MENKGLNEKTMTEILRFIAPGTPLREGIDNVLRANTGGLIVIGYNDKVKEIVDGGFQINCTFSSNFLYELAKMDGAIILNETGDRILIANAQLVPNSIIPSSETGMRHRTAQRTARQTNALVIAISQRRNVITLYQGSFRYALRDIAVILTKANQALQTLDKYKMVLEQSVTNLGILEYEELVTYNDLLQVIHRFEMVLRIKNELNGYLSELGTEGRLVQLQMQELLTTLEKEAVLMIKDYAYDKDVNPAEIVASFQAMSTKETIEDSVILKLLGYQGYVQPEEFISPRGYRILSKIPRLPLIIIENLVQHFEKFHFVLSASVQELDDVEGIGEVRARKIKSGLKSIKDQLIADQHM
ncbi:DNA integrity scanning diadenylate cyclase DisA [Mesobacillus harenae]|uniref:DNA integrity scanning diadenylate cyclase DisA n=1 Tax=Mesobacillus harenae TaxID=2213203 RepID=UPI001580548F|nr:DNA integrity scanning diadenylate cyclase DisA [Mesobacillus harenae]